MSTKQKNIASLLSFFTFHFNLCRSHKLYTSSHLISLLHSSLECLFCSTKKPVEGQNGKLVKLCSGHRPSTEGVLLGFVRWRGGVLLSRSWVLLFTPHCFHGESLLPGFVHFNLFLPALLAAKWNIPSVPSKHQISNKIIGKLDSNDETLISKFERTCTWRCLCYRRGASCRGSKHGGSEARC